MAFNLNGFNFKQSVLDSRAGVEHLGRRASNRRTWFFEVIAERNGPTTSGA